ncbi:hypothetical protein [Chitinibacter tainanensis]|uniref:hypothetical protein n=1 Tax=Chitinibacter tainanensis TaxID=230667 RepID=UPI0003F72487|nr:hypothetical protein [Chitinibacter tainanensis]
MSIKISANLLGMNGWVQGSSKLPVESLVTAAIEQVGKRVMKHAVDRMRLEAERMRELAIDYAPVDTGRLENAIKIAEDQGGINRRKRFFVYVDEQHVEDGKAVGEYLYFIHEGFSRGKDGSIRASYELGELSQAKDAGRGVVGPKFLERAGEERAKAVSASIYNAVKEVL